ncbi:MAG: hypothetical protein JWR33_1895 [Naasia sp.]|jgi:hypothetical protein|uniref:hypothetical protein n=1 Tax=Naasia sp. TaxID=2546198 RepID=UPI00260B134C|nr:hypothetical protein [Naasia sp.]MCU1571154.1 hypothetical protein [Naasia sp.]
MIVVALVFCSLLAALALFQVALIAGAPLGQFAWGGQDVVLPRNKRLGSVVSIVLYALFAYLALEKERYAGGDEPAIVSIAMWVIAGYLVLGIALNALSRSRRERIMMVPVSVALAGLALVLALS